MHLFSGPLPRLTLSLLLSADDPDMLLKYGGTQLEQMVAARKLKFPPNSKPYKGLEALCK